MRSIPWDEIESVVGPEHCIVLMTVIATVVRWLVRADAGPWPQHYAIS